MAVDVLPSPVTPQKGALKFLGVTAKQYEWDAHTVNERLFTTNSVEFLPYRFRD